MKYATAYKHNLKTGKVVLLLIFLSISWTRVVAQTVFPTYYDEAAYTPKLDSLRKRFGNRVTYKNGDHLELATLLALSHYPLLQNRKLKIIVRNVKGAPVEASFSPFNFIKFARGKAYKIIIQKNSFMDRLSLNKQVAALGHEMAHFIQYEERRFMGTLFSLLTYVLSDKARIRFEKGANNVAIDHGLGPNMLDFAFYSSKEEIKAYMDKKGYDR